MSRTVRSTALALFVLLAACDDPVMLTLDLVAGTYVATELTANGDDIIAAGGTLTMTLASDGTVTGDFTLPAAAPGGPFNADLAGTYGVSGEGVTFTQAADTFIRDATWTWDDGVLSGEWSQGTGSASVRMVRQ